MPHGKLGAKAVAKQGLHLESQRDFRHQDEDASIMLESRLCQAKIDLALAAAGYSKDQKGLKRRGRNVLLNGIQNALVDRGMGREAGQSPARTARTRRMFPLRELRNSRQPIFTSFLI